MKKIIITTLALALASCSQTPLEKQSLSYKVFPQLSSFKYEFNLAIPQVIDARETKFVRNNDQYFAEPITEVLTTTLFNEVKSANAFNTVLTIDSAVDFEPSSNQIQNIKRTTGKDAVMLARVNKFNINVRKLSDQDSSSFVNLKVFTNITYKMILTDSETIAFLTTKDTSISKVVPLNDDLHLSINEIAVKSVKENIVEAKNEFLLATKTLVAEDDFKHDIKSQAVEENNLVANPVGQKKAIAEAAIEEVAQKALDEKAEKALAEPTKQNNIEETTEEVKTDEPVTNEDTPALEEAKSPVDEIANTETTAEVTTQTKPEIQKTTEPEVTTNEPTKIEVPKTEPVKTEATQATTEVKETPKADVIKEDVTPTTVDTTSKAAETTSPALKTQTATTTTVK